MGWSTAATFGQLAWDAHGSGFHRVAALAVAHALILRRWRERAAECTGPGGSRA
jgi:hypothetical protein